MARRIIQILCVVLCVLTLSLCIGCIRSRVIMTSDPPGADVTLKRDYRGKTPITIPISWYWFYKVKVEKEGYETIETYERFRAPVWFWMPFDIVMEAMPFPIYDTKRRHYELVPKEAF